MATPLAFVTYSLVPYLGILFSPGAILTSGIALARARRGAHTARGAGGRAAASRLVLALVIFAVQLVLWWILYKVPEWGKP